MIARNKARRRGDARASPTVSFLFELNFEKKGTDRVALISKVVASSFSYRRAEEKKENEKKV